VAHQFAGEILNHVQPPNVQSQFANLHLLGSIAGQVAVERFRVGDLLFLDVLLV